MSTASFLGDHSKGQEGKGQDRLTHLYEIARTLARFESIEETLPVVISIANRALRLRHATLVWADTAGRPARVWQGERAPIAPDEALAHLRAVQDQLVGAEPGSSGPAQQEPQRVIALPLVVSGGPIFASFGIECHERPDEDDLAFANAVSEQLAIAIDRWLDYSALRRSEARSSGIVSLAADAIVSVDGENRIVQFNAAAERIFGYSAQEAIGAPLGMLLSERFRQPQEFSAERDSSGSGGKSVPVLGRRSSGEEFPAQGSISRLEVLGEPIYSVVIRDVTEARRLEAEQRFFAEAGVILSSTLDYQTTLRNIGRLAVRSLADVCIIDAADEHGRVLRLEVAAAGSVRSDLVEQLRLQPLSDPEATFSSTVLATGRTELRTLPADFPDAARDHELRHLLSALHPRQVLAVPISIRGHALGAIVLLSCESERRYGAEELRIAESFARRAEVAIDNAQLYELARRATRTRDDLLAIVSHDLGNPLSAILINLAVLQERLGPSERRLAAIQRSADQMAQLLGDLLDTVSADAGHLVVATRRLLPEWLIGDAIQAASPLAENKGLRLASELASSLPAVLADAARIQQVLGNLLSNAVKFTPAGGSITVRAERSADEVRFSVTDTGPGVAAEGLPHLFDRFWQARDTAHLGRGLGLFIARGIVELHGGKLWAESELGAGTTFFFTLPVGEPGQLRPSG
jgi:PAS domain S-box-containing protein